MCIRNTSAHIYMEWLRAWMNTFCLGKLCVYCVKDFEQMYNEPMRVCAHECGCASRRVKFRNNHEIIKLFLVERMRWIKRTSMHESRFIFARVTADAVAVYGILTKHTPLLPQRTSARCYRPKPTPSLRTVSLCAYALRIWNTLHQRYFQWQHNSPTILSPTPTFRPPEQVYLYLFVLDNRLKLVCAPAIRKGSRLAGLIEGKVGCARFVRAYISRTMMAENGAEL